MASANSERIVKLVPRLDPPPQVPQEAERLATRALVLFRDAKDASGYERAAAELRKAVRVAPWHPPILFNLALVQEKLSQYPAAVGNMRLYLLTAPANAEAARAKLYELELRAEQPPPTPEPARQISVSGHVVRPGPYPFQEGMTVEHALVLAGGVTERGSAKWVRVLRRIDGRQKQLKLKMSDLVQAGDEIEVPARFF